MGAVIPRNYAEWTQAFARAESSDAIIAAGQSPRGNLCVRTGAHVIIKPDGTRRDNVHIQEEEWIAHVRSVATSRSLGPIVKLSWLFRFEELPMNKCADAFTRDFVRSTGKNEVLAIQHETITSRDAVYDIINVETFLVAHVSLPVIDSDTLYRREGFILDRVINADIYRLQLEGFELVCKFECTQQGQFHPDKHIMRFCERCDNWFHTTCMETSHDEAPTLQRGSTSSQASIVNIPRDVQRMWDNLLLTPLQRGSPSYNWPLSFELLVLAIRSQELSSGCPPDIRSFIIDHLSLASHLNHSLDMFVQIFLNLRRPDTTYYHCPDCHSVL
ncbi:hypothetical protein FKP32DRAFT_1675106 [Trametes sanguinea]|nr:hypothetical protein FKP32DRAFT_1675106 [Trametes sanguinea]